MFVVGFLVAGLVIAIAAAVVFRVAQCLAMERLQLCSIPMTPRVGGRALPDDVARVIFHSDRDATDTAECFTQACAKFKIRPSMDRIGSAFDNGAAESFFSTLEHELLMRNTDETQAKHGGTSRTGSTASGTVNGDTRAARYAHPSPKNGSTPSGPHEHESERPCDAIRRSEPRSTTR